MGQSCFGRDARCDLPAGHIGRYSRHLRAVGEFVPLNDSFPLSVAFITRGDPIGTAFVVAYDDHTAPIEYLVTAAHIVRQFPDETAVRLRQKNGGVSDLPIPHWSVHPDPACDVAVTPLSISHDQYDYR